jgi:predicted ArsR family transcriptional regulator
LFQYFEKQQTEWQLRLEKCQSLVERATKLAALRVKEGCFGQCKFDPATGFRMEEFHNPLQRIFERYPRAVAMEQRMLEQLLGTRVVRRELPASGDGSPRVVFEMPALGVQ